MTRQGKISKADGTPADLEACPSCGSKREDALDKCFLGCPSCYSAFRVAVRRMVAQREV